MAFGYQASDDVTTPCGFSIIVAASVVREEL
jgi:hypothetical protein